MWKACRSKARGHVRAPVPAPVPACSRSLVRAARPGALRTLEVSAACAWEHRGDVTETHARPSSACRTQASALLHRNIWGTSGSHQRDSEISSQKGRERKERVKLLLGHSCASQHLALSPGTARSQVPARLLPAVLQPEGFQEREKRDSRGKPARWGEGRKGGAVRVCKELCASSLPATGRAGAAGSSWECWGQEIRLGACSANLSWGGMAAQASSARQQSPATRTSKRAVGCCAALTLTTLRMPVCHQISQVVLVRLRASSSSWRALGCQSWGGPQEREGLYGNSNKMCVIQLSAINPSPERTLK